jgi:hypothetical protein
MLVNEYELEIQFKKVRKVRNINNIPIVGSPPMEYWNVGLRRTYGQNGLYMVFKHTTFLSTRMSKCQIAEGNWIKNCVSVSLSSSVVL